jgi:hypothetical protein
VRVVFFSVGEKKVQFKPTNGFFSILTFPRFIIRPFLNAFCRLATTNGRIRPERDGLAWILPYLLAKRNVLCVKISILSYQNFFFFNFIL